MHSLLAKIVTEHQRDWDDYLNYIAFCYNTSTHQSTGYTPYFLMHGSEARWNLDTLLDTKAAKMDVNAYAAELLGRLEEAHRLTREALGRMSAYEKNWYDKRVKVENFEVGEKVRVLDLRGYVRRTSKWSLPYRQIGVITKKLNDVTYVVTAKGWRADRVLHIDKLRKLEFAPERLWASGPSDGPKRSVPGRLAAVGRRPSDRPERSVGPGKAAGYCLDVNMSRVECKLIDCQGKQ